MNAWKIAAGVCMVLSVALLISAMSTSSQGPAFSDPSGLGVSHAIGRFTPAVVVLILALWLFHKSTRR